MKAISKSSFYEIDQMIGSRLRELRQVLGFSQAVIAKAADITPQQVQKYETAANRISVSTLFVFCRALGVSPMEFFGDYFGDDVVSVAPTGVVQKLVEAELRLKAIRRLTDGRAFADQPSTSDE